jgi:BASS family bile acid:Na+ symporter
MTIMPATTSRHLMRITFMLSGGFAGAVRGCRIDTVGLAAAVFIPWMNISGSLLANYWRRRGVRDE